MNSPPVEPMSGDEQLALAALAMTCWGQDRSVEVYRTQKGDGYVWVAQAATSTLDEVWVEHESRIEALHALTDKLDPSW